MADPTLSDDEEPARGVVQSDVIDRHIRAALAERVRSMIPARVDKVNLDGSGNLASVNCKPLVGDFHRDETGALVTSSVPIINSVPVSFLTAGGFTFTVPIMGGANGTLGMLFFSDRSMDRLLSGQGQEVVDPELYHRSALTDAVFVPGLLTFGAPMDPAPPVDHATAGSIAGPRIHFRPTLITVGDEAGAQFIALANLVLSELQSIVTAFNAHIHPAGTPNTGTPVTPMAAPGSVAASQGKAK